MFFQLPRRQVIGHEDYWMIPDPQVCLVFAFLVTGTAFSAQICSLRSIDGRATALIRNLSTWNLIDHDRPNLAKVLTLNVDPHSYWLYTNTPLDNERVAAMTREHGLSEGLHRLATSA